MSSAKQWAAWWALQTDPGFALPPTACEPRHCPRVSPGTYLVGPSPAPCPAPRERQGADVPEPLKQEELVQQPSRTCPGSRVRVTKAGRCNFPLVEPFPLPAFLLGLRSSGAPDPLLPVDEKGVTVFHRGPAPPKPPASRRWTVTPPKLPMRVCPDVSSAVCFVKMPDDVIW